MTIQMSKTFAATIEAPSPGANMGQAVPRYDAREKVTGQAKYASDYAVQRPAYAYLLTSAISLGSIVSFDLEKARAIPGVLAILTYHDMKDTVADSKFFASGGYLGSTIRPMQSAEISHDGQIIAIVLAETYETAREASYLIDVVFDVKPPSASFDTLGAKVRSAKLASLLTHDDPAVGDIEKGFASADVVIEAGYSTPIQHHNPMELFTTTCSWDGDKLTIYEPSQSVYGLKNGVAEQLGVDAGNVHVVNPYVGGAFGSKGMVTHRTALIAVAAKKIKRPVKLVATRDQGFTIATYRAETRHKIRIGATRDGKLSALSHEGWEVTSRPDSYAVSGTEATSRIYACPNVSTKVNIVYADRNTPGFMRSPPEVPYMFALESAMDELAEKLGMDPVELRRVNDTMREPIKGLPYTSRSLMACFDQASSAFGWSKRNLRPGSMRDGDWLIGWGCATATYPTQMAAAAARVRWSSNGNVEVETAAHDVGTGAYTVIAQTAADKLGVSIVKVTVRLGDTSFPPSPVAGGSITTASTCSAVAHTCDLLIARMAQRVGGAEDGQRAARVEGTQLVDSRGGKEEVAAAFERMGNTVLEQYGEWTPDGGGKGDIKSLYAGRSKITGGAKLKNSIQHAFGAEFVEVRVHARTKEVRVPRIVGAFAAGRILNPRTARSQLMGGMIWGISSALHEATEIDAQTARYINDNLADYLVPVNADVERVEVIFVPETDTQVNPIGVKGLGELGNVGTNAAVANAVYHATGQRVRDLPVRIDHLIV